MTAIAAVGAAAASIGLLGWAVWVANYSDLAKAYSRNDTLEQANEKASQTLHSAETRDIADISKSLIKQAQINKMIFDNLDAMAQISQLSGEVAQLSQKRTHLLSQQAMLTSQVSQLAHDLGSADNAIEGEVKTIIATTYNSRFSELDTSAREHQFFVFPTAEVVPDNGSFNVDGFMFRNKVENFISPDDVKKHGWYDAGNFVVQAMRINLRERTDSIGFGVSKDIPIDAPPFKAFISFLESPIVASSYNSAHYLQREFDFDFDSHARVLDLFSQLLGHRSSIAIVFIPGSIAGMTYETNFIRMFWVKSIGQTMLQAAGIAADNNETAAIQVAGKLAKTTTEGSELDLSLLDQQITNPATKTLGKHGMALMQRQLEALDSSWVAELEHDGIPIDLDAGVRGEEVVRPIYRRWNWNDANDRKSATMLQNLMLDSRLKYALECISARFMSNNSIAPALNATQLRDICLRGPNPDERLKFLVSILLDDDSL